MLRIVAAALAAMWIGFGALAGLQAQEFRITKPPFRDATMGLTFGDIGEFKFTHATIPIGENLLYEVRYAGPEQSQAAVQVSTQGLESIPSGPDSKEVDQQFQLLRKEMDRQVMEKRFDAIDVLSDQVVPLGDGPTAPRFRKVSYLVKRGTEQSTALAEFGKLLKPD